MSFVSSWSVWSAKMLSCAGHVRCVGVALIALSTCVGCFGEHTPPPAKLDALTNLQTLVEATTERITKSPRRAEAEVSLLLESVDGYAASYGQPFVEFRDLVKDVLAKLQGQSNKLQIESEVGRLKSKIAELAKSA